jgi:hypothetical protein
MDINKMSDEQIIAELHTRQEARLNELKKKEERSNRSKAQKKAVAKYFKTVSNLSVRGFYKSQHGSWSRLDHEISQSHVDKKDVYKIETRQGIVKTYNLSLGFTGTVYLNGKAQSFYLKGKPSTPQMLEKFWKVNKSKLQNMGLV